MRPQGDPATPVGAEQPTEVPGAEGAVLDWAGATDVGRVRAHNEDALLVEAPLFVVADGMGGHEAGDVASSLTVERLRALAADGDLTVDAVAAELQHVNDLLQAAAGRTDEATMGTTAVGLAVVGGAGVPMWLVFNVGDSRAYCLADGELVQISRDHSYVQELVDAGRLTVEAAATHPQRHVVTRALGVDDDLDADYWLRPLKPGERFLLCSDGLSGEVDDTAIADALGAGHPAARTVADLVDLALAGGGRDNVTAVVVDVISVPGWDDATTGGRTVEVEEVPLGAPPVDTAELDTVEHAVIHPDDTAEHAAIEADTADLDTAERTLPLLPPGPPPPPADAAEGPHETEPDEEAEFGAHRPASSSPVVAVTARTSDDPELIAWVPSVVREDRAAPAEGAEASIVAVPRVETEADRDVESDAERPTEVLIEALPPGLAPARPAPPTDSPPSSPGTLRRPPHGTDI